MKKITILLVVMVVLMLSSCSTGTSNDSSNTPTDPTTTNNILTKSDSTPVTMTNIVGSWIESDSGSKSSGSGTTIQYYTYTEDTITTINSDGTFTEVETWHNTDSTNPSNKWTNGMANKGTISISGNNVSWNYTQDYFNVNGSVNLSESFTWNNISDIVTKTMKLIDGHLCVVNQREGSGSGIIGSWSGVRYEKAETYDPYYDKSVWSFSSTELTMKSYDDRTGDFNTITDASVYSYIIGTDNTIILTNSTKTQTLKVYLGSDCLALGEQMTKL